MINAGISALSPAGDTATGPDIPERIAEAELTIDRAGPDLRAMFVKGDELHIGVDEEFASAHASMFTVTVGDETLSILSVDQPSAQAAPFILSRPVAAGETVTLTHAGNAFRTRSALPRRPSMRSRSATSSGRRRTPMTTTMPRRPRAISTLTMTAPLSGISTCRAATASGRCGCRARRAR